MGKRADATMPDDRHAIMTPQLRALWNDWQNPAEDNDFFRPISHSTAMGRVGKRLLRDRGVRGWGD